MEVLKLHCARVKREYGVTSILLGVLICCSIPLQILCFSHGDEVGFQFSKLSKIASIASSLKFFFSRERDFQARIAMRFDFLSAAEPLRLARNRPAISVGGDLFILSFFILLLT